MAILCWVVKKIRKKEVNTDHGADPSIRLGDGPTPLSIACKTNPSIVKKLLERGDPLQVDAHDIILLHLACKHSNAKVFSILMDHGCDVNARDEIDETPSHLACFRGRVLLQIRMRLMALAEKRRTALQAQLLDTSIVYSADLSTRIEMITPLIDGGVEVNHGDEDVMTALATAMAMSLREEA